MLMPDYPKQTHESMSKNVAYFEQFKHKGIPLMFIDSVIPNHYRMNYAIVGDTASENPDFENQRAIATPHNFQIGMGWAPPGNGPHWHTHDYVELFVPLKGPWRFYRSNDPNPATPDGEGSFLLHEWDIISLPPACIGGLRTQVRKSRGFLPCWRPIRSTKAKTRTGRRLWRKKRVNRASGPMSREKWSDPTTTQLSRPTCTSG